MHEASIAQNLLEIALKKAKDHNAKKITLIRIKVGEFAGINNASLEFAFKNLCNETIAEGAVLKILNTPLQGKCTKCKLIFDVKKDEFKCLKCNSVEIDIISGYDLYVQDIEIE